MFIMLAVAAFSLYAPAAIAQAATEAQKSEARQLANEGSRHFKEGNYAKAHELFVQADALVPAPTFLVMAARSKERMGALIEAHALYERAAKMELGPNATAKLKAAQEEAKKALEAIDARIPTVQIVLKGAPSNTRVRIDGVEVPRERLGQPVQVTPGTHRIVASVDGSDGDSASVTLKEGSRERVELVFPENPPISELPPERPANPSDPPLAVIAPPPSPAPFSAPSPISTGAPPPSAGPNVPAILAFSVGGAGILTGIVAGAIWLSRNDDILDQCDNGQCPMSLESKIKTTQIIGRLAVAGFAIGAAGGAAGAIILWSSGDPRAPSNGAAQVVLGPGSIAARGAF